MGIRINKFLGYGLTDVQVVDYQIADPRFSSKSWVFTGEDEPSLNDYFDWLQHERGDVRDIGHITLDTMAARHRDKWDNELRRRWIRHAFAWTPEYGLSNVFAMQPVSETRWSRHDDTIDYTEETWLRPPEEQQMARVQVIPGCLYPHMGYMDKRTGDRFSDEKIYPWVRFNNRDRKEDKPDDSAVEEALAQIAGLESHTQALEVVRPVVPQEIRDLAEFSGIFTDPLTWRELQPMLYVYWG